MLFAEAVIAELLGMLFIGYMCVKHIKGSEGIATAAVVCALTVLFFIPITQHFIG